MTVLQESSQEETSLSIVRIVKAPPALLWDAWSDADSLAQWWIPAPMHCRILALDLRAGGSFRTEMSEDGNLFTPHLDACFLDVVPGERIVFTTALRGGWHPADDPFMVITAIITLTAHAKGTCYEAQVLHRTAAERDRHQEMGFFDGWGTGIDQLARLTEARLN